MPESCNVFLKKQTPLQQCKGGSQAHFEYIESTKPEQDLWIIWRLIK